MSGRKEYLPTMIERYRKAKTRTEKTRILDELVEVLGYHRKYAIQVIKHPARIVVSKVSDTGIV